jgi:pimeloyl-ACP methyl ester carboxylesterase
MMIVDRDVIRSGAELVLAKTDKWLTPRDVDASLIVLVHGFTSHGRYLTDLAGFLDGHGYRSAIFNYDSYLGIDQAAKDLAERIDQVRTPVERYGFALVAHSMGGLVARAFARISALRKDLKGVVLLGTPNSGTLANREIISYMLDWGDWLTGPNPYARAPFCRSAQQLISEDPEKFIFSLNEQDQRNPLGIPMLSISGGRPFLEFSKSNLPYAGVIRNKLLQNLLAEKPNDGLVLESSADITRVIRGHDLTHTNDYNEYPRLNHTYLTRNQAVAGMIVKWLLGRMSNDSVPVGVNQISSGRESEPGIQ